MLTRYRIVAVLLGIVVILVIGWGVYSTGHLRGEQAGEYQTNSDTYRRHAEQEIRKTCAGLDGAAQTECIVRVIEATNQHERAESDLIAQHSMALWALLMLIVTAVMAGITAFGVYYVWRTLLATQKMAKDTREIGEAQARAYIYVRFQGSSVTILEDDDSGNLFFQAELKIINGGQTPAYKIVIHYHIQDATLGEGSSFIMGRDGSKSADTFGHIPPTQDVNTTIKRTWRVPDPALVALCAERTIRVSYLIQYVDEFGTDCSTPLISGTLRDTHDGDYAFIADNVGKPED